MSRQGDPDALRLKRRIVADAAHPELLQQVLDAVERELIGQAGRDRRLGILMTRLNAFTFVAELSEEVPYGTTCERDLS